jgi:hypothetical protein
MVVVAVAAAAAAAAYKAADSLPGTKTGFEQTRNKHKKKNKNNNEKENITRIIPVPWVILRTRLFHLCRRGGTEWKETPYLPSPKYI